MITIGIGCHGPAAELPAAIWNLSTQQRYEIRRASHSGDVVDRLPAGPFDRPFEILIVSDGQYGGPPLYELDRIKRPHVRLNLAQAPAAGHVHATRQTAIEHASGAWLILSNADNLFSAGMLDAVAKTIDANPAAGFIWWRAISNLWGFKEAPRGCKLQRGCIDLACAAVRTDIAQAVGFRLPESYEGDWDYLSDCIDETIRRDRKIIGIPEVHLVHN